MNRSTPAMALGLLVFLGLGLPACSATAPVAEDVDAPRPPPTALVFPDRPPSDPPPIPAGAAPDRTPYQPGTDVTHYEVEMGLTDTDQRIWGRTAIDVMLTADAGGVFEVDFTGLAVWAVTVDGYQTPFDYRNGRLSVAAEEGAHTVEIRYLGSPDDGLIIGENVHGDATVFADNWPNRARFWFPSVDDPSDKATVRFTVHAPTQWEVIANGSLQSDPYRTPPDALTQLGYVGTIEHRTWTWASEVDIPAYTMVVGAADFAIHSFGEAACGKAPEAPNGCVEVSAWVFPQDSTTAVRQFARSAQMVDYFTDLIGDFPYEKLANVQSATRFGGMENSSAIFYSEAAIAQGRDIEGTVSHEIAHQWFGDAVTETQWSHLWLSEGFATYFGALFFEHADGVDNFRERMRSSRTRVVGSDVVRSTPVIDEDEPSLFALLNDNNYPKGGWVLHMLRRHLGDDDFFAGMRTYYRRYLHKTALTDEFRAVMEEQSGENLETFFDQWLEAPGFPVLDVSWTWSSERGGVTATVLQVQPDSWPAFVAPVDLEFTVNGDAVRHVADMQGRTTEVFIPLAAEPSEVVVDPDVWLLHELREMP